MRNKNELSLLFNFLSPPFHLFRLQLYPFTSSFTGADVTFCSNCFFFFSFSLYSTLCALHRQLYRASHLIRATLPLFLGFHFSLDFHFSLSLSLSCYILVFRSPLLHAFMLTARITLSASSRGRIIDHKIYHHFFETTVCHQPHSEMFLSPS